MPLWRHLIAPLAFPYAVIVLIRNIFYSVGIFKTHRIGAKVISVGNLTVGGTGKTPFVLELVKRLKARGVVVAVVSRGYQRVGRGTVRVDENRSDAAREFGDEPVLIAKLSGVPVYVSPKRVSASEKAISETGAKVIILDDGFQHRKLHRDADIVLLDASVPAWHFQLLPSGWAREGFAALMRANFIVLSKVSFSNEGRVKILLKRVPPHLPVLSSAYSLAGFFDLKSGEVVSAPRTVFTLCGIARPESFVSLLRLEGVTVEGSIFEPDHYSWTQADLDSAKQAAGPASIVVTEKDAVKLRGFNNIESVLVAKLKMNIVAGGEKLDELLDRVLL